MISCVSPLWGLLEGDDRWSINLSHIWCSRNRGWKPLQQYKKRNELREDEGGVAPLGLKKERA